MNGKLNTDVNRMWVENLKGICAEMNKELFFRNETQTILIFKAAMWQVSVCRH